MCCSTVPSNLTPDLYKAHGTTDRPNTLGKIWFPEIPIQVDAIQSFPANVESQIFNLNLNMDFAGPGGRRLSSLQRIVALIGGGPGLFRGLKFVYEGGENKTFCKEWSMFDSNCENFKCVESSFYIDGAAGERISAVKVGSTASLTGIKCIEVWYQGHYQACVSMQADSVLKSSIRIWATTPPLE